MKINEILSLDRVLFNVECESKKNTFELLSQTIAKADPSLSQTAIFDGLIARERLGSTGFGNGVAIPHGRLSYNQQTIASFIRLKQPIDYDAVDKQPVDLLFALIVPKDSNDKHLKILSTVAEKFSNMQLLKEIRQKKSADLIYQLLTEV